MLRNINVDWSPERTFEFIEEYRRHGALWNTRLLEYKSGKSKLEAYEELGEKFGIHVELVKKRIKNLRSAFCREHRLLTAKVDLPGKRKKWFAYDALTFLLDGDAKTDVSAATDLTSPLDASDLLHLFKSEQGDDEDLQNPPSVDNSSEISHDSHQNVVLPDVQLTADNPAVSCNGRKRKAVSSSNYHDYSDMIYHQPRGRDECSVYGEHVANEIRRLSQRSRTIAKHMINNILFEAAMGKYDESE